MKIVIEYDPETGGLIHPDKKGLRLLDRNNQVIFCIGLEVFECKEPTLCGSGLKSSGGVKSECNNLNFSLRVLMDLKRVGFDSNEIRDLCRGTFV